MVPAKKQELQALISEHLSLSVQGNIRQSQHFLCDEKGSISLRGQNKSKISRAIWTPGIKKMWALHFSRAIFGFSIFYKGLKWANIFPGHLAILVSTFCGNSSNFEGNWPKGLPYFDPWIFICFWSIWLFSIKWCDYCLIISFIFYA